MTRSQIVQKYIEMVATMDRHVSYDHAEKIQLYAAEANDPSLGHEARKKY